jgi:hypothetical protein
VDAFNGFGDAKGGDDINEVGAFGLSHEGEAEEGEEVGVQAGEGLGEVKGGQAVGQSSELGRGIGSPAFAEGFGVVGSGSREEEFGLWEEFGGERDARFGEADDVEDEVVGGVKAFEVELLLEVGQEELVIG